MTDTQSETTTATTKKIMSEGEDNSSMCIDDPSTSKENVAPNAKQMEQDDGDIEMTDTDCKDASDGSVETTDTVPKDDSRHPSPMDEDDEDTNPSTIKQEVNADNDSTMAKKSDEDETVVQPPAAAPQQPSATKMDTDETVVSPVEEKENDGDDDAPYDGPTVDLTALLNVADLTDDQQKLMSSRLGNLQVEYKESIKQQRELRLQEIKNGFKFNVNVDITDEEASFIHDFCKKHQYDPMDKIEDEGIFFLNGMREMLAERRKQRELGFDKTEKKNKRKKRRKRAQRHAVASSSGNSGATNGDGTAATFSDGSEWEAFSDEEFDDSDDSDYCDDSEPDDLLNDRGGDEMEVDGDVDGSWAEDAEERKRRRRERRANAKKGRKLNGEERCGRLLLDDALKDKDSKAGWSEARIKAFEQRKTNPNSYYYRFNDPGEKQGHGDWGKNEKKLFMERLKEKGANVQWGVFSMAVPGRVGYQCSNYYRQLILNGDIIDPNYTYDKANRKLNFRRGKLKNKKGKAYSSALNDAYKQFAFLVKRDPTGVWTDLPARHPKCPKFVLNEENDSDGEDDGKDVEENETESKKTTTKRKSKKSSTSSSSSNGKKKKGKKRRKSSDEDEAADDEAAEAPARKRRRTEKRASSTNGGVRGRKKKDDDPSYHAGSGVTVVMDENNPLPELIDMITNLPVVQPAISPYGHVLGYETWTRILRQGCKNTCPFTKQKLTRRQLTKLTLENIEEYKERIVNLTAEELGGLNISS